MAVLQASRGCPVNCKFCLGAAILGRKYRRRDVERVIENLNQIRRYSMGDKRTVFFVDNHLFIDRSFTKDLLRRILEEGFEFTFIAFGQYFLAKDQEVLDLLREAGFIRIFMGFESINEHTLKEYNKRQTEEGMRECIDACHRSGVQIHGSFMLGADNDHPQTIEDTIRFAIETSILSTSFFAMTEYPFEPHEFVPQTNMLPPHRLLADNLDYYNLNFVSHYPKHMKPTTLQRGLIRAYQEFNSPRRALAEWRNGNPDHARQRLAGWATQRLLMRQMNNYLPYLAEKESGKYSPEGILIEDALDQRPIQFQNELTSQTNMYVDRYRGGASEQQGWGWLRLSSTVEADQLSRSVLSEQQDQRSMLARGARMLTSAWRARARSAQ